MKVWVLNPPFLPKFSRPQRSPAVTKSGTLYYPLWLASAAGVLEDAGHAVTFTDAPADAWTREQTLAEASRLQPSLIVMDTSTPSIESDLRLAAALRDALPEVFLLLVGTHVSAFPRDILQAAPAVDAVARREYDHTVRDVAALLAARGARPDESSLRGVQGLSFRASGAVIDNPDRPYIENLDELPWVSRVYRRHLRIDRYFNQNALHPMVTLVTSRGCPFRCSFCVYPQTLTGRAYRFRSVPDVVREIQYVASEFPEVRSIFFEDDTLTANRKRCQEFADAMIAGGVRVPWQANSRVELDLDTMRKMKAAGCRELCVGFESGDQKILDWMNKGAKVERMFRFMSDARQAGLLVHGCFMFGFPGETPESARQTLDLALKLSPDTAQFYPVMVYPGTEAYDAYKSKGWLEAKSFADWLTPAGLHNCVIRNEHFSSAELVRLCDDARRRFYLRPGYIVYKLRQTLAHPQELHRTVKAAGVFFKYLLVGSRV
jgi:anaerobic magnesium-protoporphyrin IX monomethyl ester cyclase